MFGKDQLCLAQLMSAECLTIVGHKFDVPANTLFFAVRETLRFLYLAAHSDRTIFFPGNRLMDDVWHSLITETEIYREICERLRPGKFIHHSGLPFEQYLNSKSNEDLHAEQCSWLASYVSNFGPIDEGGFDQLKLAQSLANRANTDRCGVNTLATQLTEVFSPQKLESFNFENYLDDVYENSNAIDSDPYILKNYITKLMRETDKEDAAFSINNNSALEKLFGSSTALAFTLWQHLAAQERLESSINWQNDQPEIWDKILNNRKLCGLATTHLANPDGSRLTAERIKMGYEISGTAPWVCGLGIFDFLLIGFTVEDSIVFALIDFPISRLNPHASTVSAKPLSMSCINGTSTAEVTFSSHFIRDDQVISSRLKSAGPPTPRISRYILPEIGIAKRAIDTINNLTRGSKHPRHAMVNSYLHEINSRLSCFETARSAQIQIDTLIAVRDSLNIDAIRLLAITMGAKALKPESRIGRMQTDLLLMDTVVHSPAAMENKISHLCKGVCATDF